MPAAAVKVSRQRVYNSPTNPRHLAINLAMEFQLATLARVSEVLYHPSSQQHHHILTHEIQFFILRLLPPSPIPHKPYFINAFDAQSIDPAAFDVLEIIVTRTTSKTDQAGAGNNYSFKRNPDPAAAFDFVMNMFQWAQLARPAHDAPFFSYRGDWNLTYDKYNAAIKTVMASLGFQAVLSQFSTHSIRIGGASILAAAGFSDYVIKKMGNWKSLALLRNIRLSTETFDKCLSALSDPSILSADSVARMLPGFHSTITHHLPTIISSASSSSSSSRAL